MMLPVLKITLALALFHIPFVFSGEDPEKTGDIKLEWKRVVSCGGGKYEENENDAVSVDAGGSLEGTAADKKIKFSVLYQRIKTEKDILSRVGNGKGRFEHYFMPGESYLYLDAEGYFNSVAGINWRFIGGPGIGYRVIRSDIVDLDLESGVAYISDDIDSDISVQDERDAVTLRVGASIIEKINEKLELWQRGEYLPEIDDYGRYIIRVNVGANFPVCDWAKLSCQVGTQYDSTSPEDMKYDKRATLMAIFEF